MCPWQLHRRPGPYVTSGQTEWSWCLMSCRKETGDISNDHISDQLVLEPEELVLTDVTARTGLAFFLRPSSNILQFFSCKNLLKVLVCICKHSNLGFFSCSSPSLLEPHAMVVPPRVSQKTITFGLGPLSKLMSPCHDLI